VPVPPGGVADPIARILADHLTVTLGQPVVIENVTGAGGSIGVGRAVRAASDGYTVSIGNWLSHVGASGVYPVQYDVPYRGQGPQRSPTFSAGRCSSISPAYLFRSNTSGPVSCAHWR
jgi:hypothetical protein